MLFSNKFQKLMRWRYVSYVIAVSIIHMISWFFVMSFCTVYINSNKEWLYGCLISVIIDFFIVCPLFSIIKGLIRWLAKTFPNK